MSQPQLLLTPVTVQAIKGLIGRGHRSPISYDTIALRKVRREDYRLNVPHGYVIHYDTGHYKPRWVCRHMSIKGPVRWPGMEEVRRLMVLAGFKSTLEEVASWHDGQARRTIHLLEPLDGNWSPLRSS
jgi:hypothetical protein